MLIVCPNCATSYMVDPGALGSGGRTVRCSRCKTTWFASLQKQAPSVNAFVDGVIAEAEAQSGAVAEEPAQAAPAAEEAPAASDEAGLEPAEPAEAAQAAAPAESEV